MTGESKTTTDHQVIKQWIEERGGYPATVEDTMENGEPGILRIDFPGYSGEQSLKRISWEEFFEAFEENHLAFLYQDKLNSGETSRFFKFIARNEKGE